jgi:DNA-binding transcriptional LysR family regulator
VLVEISSQEHRAEALAVAEEGSFTRAADRLHVVQSAVSAGVRNLEKELGVMLFDRSAHSVKLADAGRALLPEARAAHRKRRPPRHNRSRPPPAPAARLSLVVRPSQPGPVKAASRGLLRRNHRTPR